MKNKKTEIEHTWDYFSLRTPIQNLFGAPAFFHNLFNFYKIKGKKFKFYEIKGEKTQNQTVSNVQNKPFLSISFRILWYMF